MKTLPTWAGRSNFRYSGSVAQGTKIMYGRDRIFKVREDQYKALLKHFGIDTVSIGTSRDNRPSGSVGEWLGLHVTPIAIASYVGPILAREGYARKVGASEIRFLGKS